jgi:uncharacterized iron-regulated protein
MTRLIPLLVLLLTTSLFAQTPQNYAVYDGKGRVTTLDAIVASLSDADVAFLGEDHDDIIGHEIQLEIFKRVLDRYSAKRKVTLSLEMFERDVQVVVDEYLKEQISETHFLRSSRPWDNYKRDYRPMLEMAKLKKLDVVAANAPRRYVNMVSRNGIASLAGLTPEAKRWLPPFPIAKPSEAYSTKFKKMMGNTSDARLGLDNILISQSLWDASMAHAVSQSLKKNPRSLVVHLNGYVHTENRLGTVEHLLAYRPKTKAVVVTILPVDDIKKFEHAGSGDFIVLTDKQNSAKRVEVLNRMNIRYQSLQTLTADIQRTRYNVQLDASEESKGKLIFVPARRKTDHSLRIDWLKPQPESLSIIERQYVLFLPSTNIAYYGSILPTDRMPIFGQMFAMGSEQSREWIEKAEYIGERREQDGRALSGLRLAPTAKKDYMAIEIWVDQDGLVSSGKLIAENGDTDEVVFSNMKFNQTIEIKSFQINVGNAKRIKS